MHPILLVEVKGYGLFTVKAYEELTLQMSTGDFCTHVNRMVRVPADAEYFDVDKHGEFITINEVI